MKIGYLVLSVTVYSAPFLGSAAKSIVSAGTKFLSAAKNVNPSALGAAAKVGLSNGATSAKQGATQLLSQGQKLAAGAASPNGRKILAAGTVGAIGGAGLASLNDNDNSDNTVTGMEFASANGNSDNSWAVSQDPALFSNFAEGPMAI